MGEAQGGRGLSGVHGGRIELPPPLPPQGAEEENTDSFTQQAIPSLSLTYFLATKNNIKGKERKKEKKKRSLLFTPSPYFHS